MTTHTLLWDPDLQAAGDLEVQKAAGIKDLEVFAVLFRDTPVCPILTPLMKPTKGTAVMWRGAAEVSRKVWGKLAPGVDAPDHKSASRLNTPPHAKAS